MLNLTWRKSYRSKNPSNQSNEELAHSNKKGDKSKHITTSLPHEAPSQVALIYKSEQQKQKQHSSNSYCPLVPSTSDISGNNVAYSFKSNKSSLGKNSIFQLFSSTNSSSKSRKQIDINNNFKRPLNYNHNVEELKLFHNTKLLNQEDPTQQLFPIESVSTIKKGAMWQQRNYEEFYKRMFSRWKKLYFILTTDYLVCFKRSCRGVGRSEMGKFLYKVALQDFTRIGYARQRRNNRGIISLRIEGHFNLYLWCKEGLDEWMFLIKDAVTRCKTRKQVAQTKFQTDSVVTKMQPLNNNNNTSNSNNNCNKPKSFDETCQLTKPDDLYENTCKTVRSTSDDNNSNSVTQMVINLHLTDNNSLKKQQQPETPVLVNKLDLVPLPSEVVDSPSKYPTHNWIRTRLQRPSSSYGPPSLMMSPRGDGDKIRSSVSREFGSHRNSVHGVLQKSGQMLLEFVDNNDTRLKRSNEINSSNINTTDGLYENRHSFLKNNKLTGEKLAQFYRNQIPSMQQNSMTSSLQRKVLKKTTSNSGLPEHLLISPLIGANRNRLLGNNRDNVDLTESEYNMPMNNLKVDLLNIRPNEASFSPMKNKALQANLGSMQRSSSSPSSMSPIASRRSIPHIVNTYQQSPLSHNLSHNQHDHQKGRNYKNEEHANYQATYENKADFILKNPPSLGTTYENKTVDSDTTITTEKKTFLVSSRLSQVTNFYNNNNYNSNNNNTNNDDKQQSRTSMEEQSCELITS